MSVFNPRIADQGDVEAIDVLLSRAYPILLRPDYDADLLERCLPFISRAQPDLVTCGTYYVIEEKGQVIAAGGWTVAAPGNGPSVDGEGHIRHVVTDERVLRRGVARCLLTHIFEEARKAGVNVLHSQSTLTAVPFYEALGFKQVAPIDVVLQPDLVFPSVAMIRRQEP